MVIWPNKISSDDDGWVRACALLQVLALDPRQPRPRGFKPRQYFERADDFLIRPKTWVDTKQVPAPYFSYILHFNVSASVCGSIPIDAADEIEEFKRRVNSALQSPLTLAERKRWEADYAFRKCCAASDPLAPAFAMVCGDEGRKADCYYHEVREAIEASRRHTGYVAASLSRHEEVLDGLIRLGTTLLRAA